MGPSSSQIVLSYLTALEIDKLIEIHHMGRKGCLTKDDKLYTVAAKNFYQTAKSPLFEGFSKRCILLKEL